MLNTSVFYGYGETGDPSVLGFMQDLAEKRKLLSFEGETGLKFRFSGNGEKDLIFAFNYTDHAIRSTVRLRLDGKPYVMNFEVPAKGVVIREQKIGIRTENQ